MFLDLAYSYKIALCSLYAVQLVHEGVHLCGALTRMGIELESHLSWEDLGHSGQIKLE
jgi:hypothetical protein